MNGAPIPQALPPPTAKLTFPEAGVVVQVEVAQSPAELARGLMGRAPLPDGRGMLFDLNACADHKFWMVGTPAPLDLVFIDDGAMVAGVIVNAAPNSPAPLSIGRVSRYVLEVPAGWAARHGVGPGQGAVLQPLSPTTVNIAGRIRSRACVSASAPTRPTAEQIGRAKEAVRRAIGCGSAQFNGRCPPWVRGIGVGVGPTIVVGYSTSCGCKIPKLPRYVFGVPVVLQYVGDVATQTTGAVRPPVRAPQRHATGQIPAPSQATVVIGGLGAAFIFLMSAFKR